MLSGSNQNRRVHGLPKYIADHTKTFGVANQYNRNIKTGVIPATSQVVPPVELLPNQKLQMYGAARTYRKEPPSSPPPRRRMVPVKPSPELGFESERISTTEEDTSEENEEEEEEEGDDKGEEGGNPSAATRENSEEVSDNGINAPSPSCAYATVEEYQTDEE